MGTRAIVTSRPDVACYVCERHLLRGEHHEVFLADGMPRTVCELCAPRAIGAGWPREHEGYALSQSPPRGRRGRGLFARLRHSAGSNLRAEDGLAAGGSLAGEHEGEPGGSESADPGSGAITSVPTAEGPLERALEAFNLSTYPRRIASLARSLGAPEVSVELDPDLRLVVILVAWELCWYRYRVDLDEEEPEVEMSAQGSELSELGPDVRSANALADERGAISLIAAGV